MHYSGSVKIETISKKNYVKEEKKIFGMEKAKVMDLSISIICVLAVGYTGWLYFG